MPVASCCCRGAFNYSIPGMAYTAGGKLLNCIDVTFTRWPDVYLIYAKRRRKAIHWRNLITRLTRLTLISSRDIDAIYNECMIFRKLYKVRESPYICALPLLPHPFAPTRARTHRRCDVRKITPSQSCGNCIKTKLFRCM